MHYPAPASAASFTPPADPACRCRESAEFQPPHSSLAPVFGHNCCQNQVVILANGKSVHD